MPPSRKPPKTPTPIHAHKEISPLRQHYFDLLSDPLGFVADVSGMLTVLDPRSRPALGGAEPVTDLGSFVQMVAADVGAETTVLLRAIAAMATGPAATAAARAADARDDNLLPWADGLQQAKVTDVARMQHRLGDGGNHLFEVRAPGLPVFTMVAYVDTLAGVEVRDAFFVPESLDSTRHRMRQLDERDEFAWLGGDRALMRGTVEHGIRIAAMTQPPTETDSWPMSRPMLEWVLRMLPASVAPPEPTIDDQRTSDLLVDFLDSAPGREVVRSGTPTDRVVQIAELLIAYAVLHATGDPLMWHERSVAHLLTDFWPRKVAAPQLDGTCPRC